MYYLDDRECEEEQGVCDALKKVLDDYPEIINKVIELNNRKFLTEGE